MGNRRTLSGVPSGKRARTMPEKTVPAASAPAPCAIAKSGGGEVPVTRPGGTKSLPEDQLLLSGRKITALPEHAGKRLPGRSAFPGTRLPPPLLKKRNRHSGTAPLLPCRKLREQRGAPRRRQKISTHNSPCTQALPRLFRLRSGKGYKDSVFAEYSAIRDHTLKNISIINYFLWLCFIFPLIGTLRKGRFAPCPCAGRKKKR